MPMMDDAGAVLAGPNADQTQPAPSEQVPPAPEASGLPVDTRQAPPAPQPVNPVADAVMRHATFGAAVKSILGALNGQQTVYAANPQTGQVEEQSIPTKPGQWARNLVAGMLIGGAAAGGGQGGFLGGLSRGGAAVIQNRQQQDQQQYDRAQQQMKNEQETAKAADDAIYHHALTAHLNAQIASWQHDQWAADQAEIERKNTAAKAYEKSLLDSGAVQAHFSVDGKFLDEMPANDFARAVIKDPSILHASDPNYSRHFIDVTKNSEITFDGRNWVTADGSPANMGNFSEVKAYDLPTNNFKTYRQVDGKTLNQIRGVPAFDPDKTYSVTPEGISGLYTVNVKEQAEGARAAASKARADHAAQQSARNAQLISNIENRRATALQKANAAYQKAIESGSDPDEAADERDQARENAQTAYNNSMAALKAPGNQTPPSGPAPKPNARPNASAPSYKVGDTVTLKNGQRVNITKINPNGTFEYR